MANTYAQVERSNSILATLRAAIAGVFEGLERRRVFERTYNELSALGDRELADIGVDRTQLAQIAWETSQR